MFASDVIEHARDLLVDPDGIRWVDTDMLRWVGDALRAVAHARPSEASVTVAHLLTKGDTKQTLPSDAFMLIDIRRNLGSDGLTVGKPIRGGDLDQLRAFDTTWHTGTGVTEISNYSYIANDDTTLFWVDSPPDAVTDVYVELVYAKIFDNPASMSAVLPVGDEYLEALSEYVAGKAFMVDTDVGDPQQAERHMGRFQQLIGGISGGDTPE